MSDWKIISSVAVAYLIFILFVGLKGGKKESSTSLEGYLAGGRSLGFLVLFFIIGAEFYSSATFLGAPGWAYSRGAPAIYLLVAFSLSLLPWWWIGIRTARVGKHYGFLTQGDLLGARFASRTLSSLVAIVGIIALVPYLVIQIVGSGYLFSAATGGNIPYWLGAFLVFMVVVLYTFSSGLQGIGWTNVVQGVIMLIVAWTIGLSIPARLYGGVTAMFEQLATQAPDYLTIPGHNNVMPWGEYSSAMAIMLLGMTMWPHLFNRAYGADSEDSIKRSIMVFPIFGLLLLPILFVGFAGILAVESLESPDQIMIALIEEANYSPWFVGLILSGALAATMSTGANLLHTTASILLKDFYLKFSINPINDKGQVQIARFLVVVVFFICYLLALDPPQSIFSLVLIGFGALAQILPGVVVAFLWSGSSKQGVIGGLSIGIIVTAYFTFMATPPFGFHAGIIGFLFNVIVLVSISYLKKPDDFSYSREFIQIATRSMD